MGLLNPSVEIFIEDILVSIKDIVDFAKPGEKVYLISPYWSLNVHVRDCIQRAHGRGVNLRCLMRLDQKLADEDKSFLDSQGILIRQLDHLHAKLYWSKRLAVVTSMNLINYSDKETRELALAIKDRGYLRKLEVYADEWWDKSVTMLTPSVAPTRKTKNNTKKKEAKQSTARGYCIRCGKEKTYNPEYPLCDKCYAIWAQFRDRDYPEKQCHGCGKEIDSSVAKPLCRTCYKKDQFDKL